MLGRWDLQFLHFAARREDPRASTRTAHHPCLRPAPTSAAPARPASLSTCSPQRWYLLEEGAVFGDVRVGGRALNAEFPFGRLFHRDVPDGLSVRNVRGHVACVSLLVAASVGPDPRCFISTMVAEKGSSHGRRCSGTLITSSPTGALDEPLHEQVVYLLSGHVGHAEDDDALIEPSFRRKSCDDLFQAQVTDMLQHRLGIRRHRFSSNTNWSQPSSGRPPPTKHSFEQTQRLELCSNHLPLTTRTSSDNDSQERREHRRSCRRPPR